MLGLQAWTSKRDSGLSLKQPQPTAGSLGTAHSRPARIASPAVALSDDVQRARAKDSWVSGANWRASALIDLQLYVNPEILRFTFLCWDSEPVPPCLAEEPNSFLKGHLQKWPLSFTFMSAPLAMRGQHLDVFFGDYKRNCQHFRVWRLSCATMYTGQVVTLDYS